MCRSLTQSPYTHFLADDSGRVVVEFYRQTVAPVPDYWAMNPFVFHIAFLADDLPGAHARLIAAGAAPAGDVTVAADGDRLIFFTIRGVCRCNWSIEWFRCWLECDMVTLLFAILLLLVTDTDKPLNIVVLLCRQLEA
jgi:hypothetical protein